MNIAAYTSCATIVLAIAALLVGLNAARLWFRASKVPIDPGWGTGGIEDGHKGIEPVDPIQSQGAWLFATIQAAVESADLNKRAVFWTAIAVVLGAISNLLGAVSNYK